MAFVVYVNPTEGTTEPEHINLPEAVNMAEFWSELDQDDKMTIASEFVKGLTVGGYVSVRIVP